MWRIRKADLKYVVERLNQESKGKYGLDSAYGKWQLVRFCNGKDTRDGVTVLTRFMTKRELWEAIHTILAWLQEEELAQ